jgi:predicted kinase
MIAVVFGLPGSGKSFFARQLAIKIDAVYIGSDQVRQGLLEPGKYDERSKLGVYEKMLALTEDAVVQQKNVVLDATFYKEHIRQLFKEQAKRLDNPLYFIEMKAAERVIKERISQKRPDSEADFEVYLELKRSFEAMDEDHLVLHSDKEELSVMLNKALICLKDGTG